LEALGINLGFLFVQIINFIILFLVLRKWVFGPILSVLERRRETIAQGLEDARVAAEERANAEAEAQNILSEAQAKASQVIREATERAEGVANDIKVAAEADVVKAREAALADVAQERDQILANIRNQVAALSIAAAQKLVGEALDEKRQHALINEFFSGVKAGKVVVLEDMNISGASAEVTSALPLTPEEEKTVKESVLAKAGTPATVTFRVDPAILGGLVIRVGDKVLDGSVAGQLGELRQTLR
jgi:F-type H+-transporting ATPase subunit b